MASAVIRNVDGLFSDPEFACPSEAPPERGASALVEDFIEREIGRRLAKHVSWKQLEPCFKWRRVREYLLERGVTDSDPFMSEVKGILKRNMLQQLEYDASLGRVVKLGHGDM